MKSVRVPEWGADTNRCLIHVITEEGYVHAAWELPDGQVLVFDEIPKSYPSGGYSLKNSRADYWKSIVEISWIPGTPVEPPAGVMYNSHGHFTTLQEIYEIETERGNATFDDVDPKWLQDHKDCLAIWATTKPLAAWMYAIDAEEWNLSEDELKEKYPNCIEDVEHIHTDGMVCIAEDGDEGYLLVYKAENTNPPILSEPFSKATLRKRAKDSVITGVVKVSLGELMSGEHEALLDVLADKLVGSPMLMDIQYRPVGAEGNDVLIEVSGDVSEVLDEDDEDIPGWKSEIRCFECGARDENITAFVEAGGLVNHNGRIKLLQILEEGNYYLLYPECGVSAHDMATCSECGHRDEVANFTVSSPGNVPSIETIELQVSEETSDSALKYDVDVWDVDADERNESLTRCGLKSREEAEAYICELTQTYDVRRLDIPGRDRRSA